MANFDEAFAHVIGAEGGYVNHPDDRGSATNWGITQSTLSNHLGRPASVDDVKNMTLETAKAIYRKSYWDNINLDSIKDETLALLVFDQAVNRGARTAIMELQGVLKREFGKALVVDGRFGPASLSAVEAVDALDLCNKFIQNAQDDYVQIVKSKPSQMAFLAGWINRSQKLFDLVFEKIKHPLSGGSKPKAEGKFSFISEHLFDDGVRADKIESFLKLWDEKTPGANYGYFINYDKPDTTHRMYLYSLKDQSVTSMPATHGSGTDPNDDGIADHFSNRSGSYMSSLGRVITGGTYTGKNGLSLNLMGQDPTNDKMYVRRVVIHKAGYALTGGRSQGCPAIPPAVYLDVIGKLKNGSPGFHYHKSLV